MKERIKSYKFWVALSGAIVIFVKALGDAFGFEISADVIDGVIMGFCGVLAAMGLVEKPTKSITENENKNLSKREDVGEIACNEAETAGSNFENINNESVMIKSKTLPEKSQPLEYKE